MSDDAEFYPNNNNIFNSSLYKQTDIGKLYKDNIVNNTALKSGIVIKVYCCCICPRIGLCITSIR